MVSWTISFLCVTATDVAFKYTMLVSLCSLFVCNFFTELHCYCSGTLHECSDSSFVHLSVTREIPFKTAEYRQTFFTIWLLHRSGFLSLKDFKMIKFKRAWNCQVHLVIVIFWRAARTNATRINSRVKSWFLLVSYSLFLYQSLSACEQIGGT